MPARGPGRRSAAPLLEDVADGTLLEPSDPAPEAIELLLADREVRDRTLGDAESRLRELEARAEAAERRAAFAEQLSGRDAGSLSCNCILNFVYGGLEGKKTPGFTGPVTFGEIAYILLNQTLVTLECKAA